MKKKYARQFILIIIIFLFIFLFFFILAKVIKELQINKVIIISENTNIYGLAILNGQNLFSLNLDKISQDLLKQNPDVKTIKIEKIYPSAVTIFVETRKPIAKINVGSGQYYLDKDGVVLIINRLIPDLPNIDIENFYINDKKLSDWRLTKLSILIPELSSKSIIIDQVIVDDKKGEFLITVLPGSQIIMPYNGDIGNIVASLQVIISRFRIEGKIISKIDFRFDKPLVTFSDGEKISSKYKVSL